jgi:hypothetical protein
MADHFCAESQPTSVETFERGDALKVSVSVTLLALVSMGCTATRSLPLVSTNNLAPSYPPSQQRVTGEDCVYNVFGIPISYNNNPSVHRAIDNAASMTPGGYTMTDITIHRDILILFVYNEACIRVDSNAVARSTGNSYLDAVQRDFYWNE